MPGCPIPWPTVQLPIVLAFFIATTSAQIDDTNASYKECNFALSKNYTSSYDSTQLTVLSELCKRDKWVSSEKLIQHCCDLLQQKFTARGGFSAPVLHCRDDETISVTWSKNPNSFDPTDGDDFVYLLEIQEEDSTLWTLLNATRRLIGVARNLKGDTWYRFRVQKLGLNYREMSSDGEWIRTFRNWSSEQTSETLSHPIRVYKTQPYSFYNNLTASVLIKWDPGKDKTCWYNVLIDNLHHDEPLRHIKVNSAEVPTEKVINNLKVGAKYIIRVSGLEKNNSHSGKYNMGELPSCEVYPVNLNFTGPPAPIITNVTHRVINRKDGNNRVDITVFWEQIPGGPPSNFTILVHSGHQISYRTVVNGITLSGTIKNVPVQWRYVVEVFASSPGGEGGHKKWDAIEVEFPPPSSVISVVVGSLLVIPVVCAAVVFRRQLSIYILLRQCFAKPRSSANDMDLKPIVCFDKWEIPQEKLVIGQEIGRGAFGTVHRALLSQPTGLCEVAVKKLRADPASDDARQFRLEMDIMKGVDKHQNVLSLVGCVTMPEAGLPYEQLLVVEYCALGDLQSFLRKAWKQMAQQSSPTTYVSVDAKYMEYAHLMSRDSSSGSTCGEDVGDSDSIDEHSDDHPLESQALAVSNQTYGLYLGMEGGMQSRGSTKSMLDSELVTPAELLSFARQVAIGMEFLSSCRVVHRDLAARNVLVCADRTVKISDFGLSRDIYERDFYKKAGAERIPVKWMAIESLMHQTYTTKSDVWSFGILLWEIATLGGSPYPSISNDALFELLRSGYRMERPSTCGAELYQLMCDCWQADPKARPSFLELKHRLDNLLQAAAPHYYIHIDQLFGVTLEENATL